MKEPLDSRQLLAFLQVSRTASFTAAARQLHLSQSAVSHSVRGLEEAVGCALFDRVGKKALLTLAGEQLLHHAEKIFREMAEAKEALRRLGRWGRGRLRIGATPTACQYILPPVLLEFKEPFPDYQITIHPGDTDVVLERLRQRQLDVVLALEPRRTEDFDVHRVFEDELQFIIARDHPWAVAGRISRSEIATQNYVLYHRSSHTFRLVDDYFRAERIALNTVIELGSMEAIKELVKIGIGISILAPWIAQRELRSGALVALPLGRRRLVRHWSVFQPRGSSPTLAEETFIALCRSVTENMTVAMSSPHELSIGEAGTALSAGGPDS